MDLAAIPPDAAWALAAGALALALAQTTWLLLRRVFRRRRLAVRMHHAAVRERDAATWLEAAGYEILGAQVAIEHAVRIDDADVVVPLRADYLATRGGARYVVEVKTGRHAPRLETSATRRQILEYRVAFDVDGVLLVDGETKRIQEVTFPKLARFDRRGPLGWPMLGATLVAVLVAAAFGAGATGRFWSPRSNEVRVSDEAGTAPGPGVGMAGSAAAMRAWPLGSTARTRRRP